MDSVTQAALGGAIGGAILGKEKGPKAFWTGALIATLPDLDVLFYLFFDPMEMLSIHRGVSHSFLFSLIAGLVIAYILSKTRTWGDVGFWRLTIFSWWCLITHIMLDAFTAYGTQLWAPFSDLRVSLDSINVVDPVYTLPLLIGIALSIMTIRKKSDPWKFTRWGLIVSTAYLFLTLANKQNIEAIVNEDMARQGVETDAVLTIPVGVANIHWYGVGKTTDSIFLRPYDLMGRTHGPMAGFAIRDSLFEPVDPEVAQCMRWFAKNFYSLEETQNGIRIYNLQVDMRGVIDDGQTYAPTHGYFEVQTKEGRDSFGSGSHN